MVEFGKLSKFGEGRFQVMDRVHYTPVPTLRPHMCLIVEAFGPDSEVAARLQHKLKLKNPEPAYLMLMTQDFGFCASETQLRHYNFRPFALLSAGTQPAN